MPPIISCPASLGNWLLAAVACMLAGCASVPRNEEEAADLLAAAGATFGETLSGIDSLSWQTPEVSEVQSYAIGELKYLEELNLRVAGGKPVVASRWHQLKHLRRLELRGPAITDRCLLALSPAAPVELVRLRGTAISSAGLVHLDRYATLRELDLSETAVDNAEISTLARAPNLEKLNLWRTKVGDEGLAAIADAPALAWLNVDNTAVTDAGLPHLAKLSKLKYLHLGSTTISDAGVDDLSKLTQLDELIVTRTQLTDDGIARLKAALPKTKITHIYMPKM